ncbi:MAG TPA: thioredoxin [Blastocatellia bacterium]|nr:thioredoxin [Blastocatellia bacterium]
MSEFVKEVSDDNFEQEVLGASEPVLVDFWAEWCQPCRMIAPTVEAIAEKYQGKARVVKLNVDNNNQTAVRYTVRSIPTLIVFKGGNEVDRAVGAKSKESIAQMLDRALGASEAKV